MTLDEIERMARIAGAKADLTDESGSNLAWVFGQGTVHNLGGMSAFADLVLEKAALACIKGDADDCAAAIRSLKGSGRRIGIGATD